VATSALLPTCPLCRAPCSRDSYDCELSSAAAQIHIDADDENLIDGGGGSANTESEVRDYVVINARERMYQI